MIKNSVLELIGQTPIVKLNRLVPENGADIYAKLEFYNPGSSVKDRIALNMIEKAEKENKINKDTIIIEPTSGNTGIGLAMVGANKGYKVILVMPDTMSIERRKLLKAFGAELILTDGSKGMKGAIDEAERILKENDNYYMPSQFDNPSNPEIHEKTTAVEIIDDMGVDFDAFIAGVGTGGTLSGTARGIKKLGSNAKIIAVEPDTSAVISGEGAGPHKIQGIGAGFIPENLDVDLIDEIIKVKDEDALDMARKMATEEGILVGISSGAVITAARKKSLELGKGKKIVVIIPSYGERYLSTVLFENL
ncbi:MAG: cysteine synthase A [Firmicutes bacterium]|jgi:cysteine synthase A|nr:cysteine synthase A [Bacillota bacterium]